MQERNELHYYIDEAEACKHQLEKRSNQAPSSRQGFLSKLQSRYRQHQVKKMLAERKKREKARLAELIVPFDGLNHEPRKTPLIVSLTSFPARVNCVAAVVGGMLRQTLRPDKICVWLGKEKFPDEVIPAELARLRDAGLVEVNFREDIKPHTKYFYAMQEYPDAAIVTVDDDIIYRETLLEELWNSYLSMPDCVSCARAHKIRFDREGALMPYNDWIMEYRYHVGKPSDRLLATGVGGVLYPPRCFGEEAFNLPVIKETCLSADDLWLKVMELRYHRKVVLCADSSIPQEILSTAWGIALANSNLKDENDRQMQAILKHYGMNLIDYMDDEV